MNEEKKGIGTPLRNLIGKTLTVKGFNTMLIGTNNYLVLEIEIDDETNNYYTTSSVIHRQLDEIKDKQLFPFTTEFISGSGKRGRWFAFRSELLNKK